MNTARVQVVALLLALGGCHQGPDPNQPLNVIRTEGSIGIDGLLSEPEWRTASSTGRLRRADGRDQTRLASEIRLLWTTESLVMAFECQDDDLVATYSHRDEPIYLQEVVEVFLDADEDERDYLEFEVSPAAVLFDAVFQARRSGMDIGFNPDVQVAVRTSGTLNNHLDEDSGWSVELSIPFRSLVGRGRFPPAAGDCWRANFFRIDKSKNGDEAAAWRPTAGDFHDLAAFGRLCFKD